MGKQEINIDLIGKYLAGEASPEEAMEADRMRNASAEASEEFNAIASVWYKIRNEAVYSPAESSVAWNEFKEKFFVSKRRSRTKKIFFRFAVAASVLLICATATIVYLLIQKKQLRVISGEEYIVAKKDSSQLILPDNSTVTLLKGSSFKYKKSGFNAHREIALSGNARFEITHISGSSFIVNTGNIGIKVVGTIFNVGEDGHGIEVSVKRGTVLVYHQQDTLVVKHGSLVSFNKQTQKLAYIKSEAATAATLVFNDASMSEVKKALENAYQINIVFENDLISQCRISTQFQGRPLKYVLDIIAASLAIEYKQENNTVYFYGHACN